MAQPAADGAVPLVLAAAGDGARNGAYYGPTGMGGMRGKVGDAQVGAGATEPDLGRALWELSEEAARHQLAGRLMARLRARREGVG